eukprot:TRINITY_DN6753_c0_g1_i1.p1 TRINITY_DN6753_c0_g1~~TRINITY_DN6753_c0_g1_i1.p1  ORF type:complete len:341 (+),score=-9.74 TRINITY_DN6753_c0_g1_i1:57-1025(+)
MHTPGFAVFLTGLLATCFAQPSTVGVFTTQNSDFTSNAYSFRLDLQTCEVANVTRAEPLDRLFVGIGFFTARFQAAVDRSSGAVYVPPGFNSYTMEKPIHGGMRAPNGSWARWFDPNGSPWYTLTAVVDETTGAVYSLAFMFVDSREAPMATGIWQWDGNDKPTCLLNSTTIELSLGAFALWLSAFDSGRQVMYSTDGSAIIRFEIATQKVEVWPIKARGLAFDSTKDVLYSIVDQHLVSIDPVYGVITVRGSSEYWSRSPALVMDSVNQVIYLPSTQGLSDLPYSGVTGIDVATGMQVSTCTFHGSEGVFEVIGNIVTDKV